jgi:endoglucanase
MKLPGKVENRECIFCRTVFLLCLLFLPIHSCALFQKVMPEVDESIHINQIGYQPNQVKKVVVVGTLSPKATFQLLDSNNQIVFSGTLVNYGYDHDTDETVAHGDFSAYNTPGQYRIKVAGRLSYPFIIDQDVYLPVLKMAARWLYLQRSGTAKDDPITGIRHSADHTTPAILFDGNGIDPDQTFDVSGGWWDAGDYGRYVPSATTTLMLLFYAYHFNPDMFQDSQFNIPESGNGIPDLLNEARWELKWLLKMQRNDGAVFHKVTTSGYAHTPPAEDALPLYLFDISTQATPSFAISTPHYSYLADFS